MNQYEVPALLADELPEIEPELKHLSVLGNANSAIQVLTSFTSRKIIQHDLRMVQRCMQVADRIYTRGNNIIRNAVENIFVFSFSTLRTECNRTEWRILQQRMPITLYSVYVNQVLKTGA